MSEKYRCHISLQQLVENYTELDISSEIQESPTIKYLFFISSVTTKKINTLIISNQI